MDKDRFFLALTTTTMKGFFHLFRQKNKELENASNINGAERQDRDDQENGRREYSPEIQMPQQ